MYLESDLPSRILIVKLSSLGDIIQSWLVLDALKQRFPKVQIDWVVEKSLASLLTAHPLISEIIPIDIRGKKDLCKSFSLLRKKKYDLVFDLQGNTKSGLVTAICRAEIKVGYGKKSAREWPNRLFTRKKIEVDQRQNISRFYLGLIEGHFQDKRPFSPKEILLETSLSEKKWIKDLIQKHSGPHIMVCPGTSWPNKQLDEKELFLFLKRVEEVWGAHLLLVWGNQEEKELCSRLSKIKNSEVVEKLSFPVWQNLMATMDLVIAVDSCALHLCSTTLTPSFSIFGPTSSLVFKPEGKEHVAVQGKCPYNQTFEKQCPLLRSCKTGACIRSLKGEWLFQELQNRCVFRPHSLLLES